jgi:ubiquinone/menaquinone biosynthesis C-methylase UbiE
LHQNAELLKGELLDVGCGSGIQVGFALEYADHVVGIDASEGLLEIAKHKFPDVDFRCCDARNLPFSANSFNTVISYGEVLSHIPDYAQVFAQISRVLKPGGFFLFSILNKWCIHTLLSPQELKKALKSKEGHWRTWACYGDEGELIAMDLKTFSQRELRHILRQNGLDLITTEGIHITSLLVPLHLQYGKMNRWGRLFALLGAFDRYISKALFFRSFGYTKMIVARKL